MCVYCHMSKKSRVGRNQQQCFIYSTASFLSKLRAKKVEKLHNSSFYRKFRNRNTGTGNDFPVLPIKKKKKINPCCWLNNKNGYLTNQNNFITYFEVNCKQKVIFIVLTTGSLCART
jgi:hypothetical protein